MPDLIAGAPALDVELYVGGVAFRLDDPELGRLDAGNVLGPTDDGWLDLTAATTRATWRNGATDTTGPRARMQPGFGRVELYDPTRRYDPGNPSGPFRGRFRVDQPARIVARTPERVAPPFVDDFAGPAGPLDNPWAALVGVWTITGDGHATASAGGRALALVPTDDTAGRVAVRCTMGPGAQGACGLVIAADPTGVSCITVQWQATSGGRWAVYYRPPSSWVSLGFLPAAAPTEPVEAVVDYAAATLTVTAGDGAPVTYTIPRTLTGRHVGMMTNGAAGSLFAELTAQTDVIAEAAAVRPQFVGRLSRAGWESGTTRLELVDGMADLAAYDPPEGDPVGAGETSGQRVARVLAEAGYRGPAAIDAGTVTLQATALAQTALAELYRVADSELGALFVDRAGVLTFHDRRVWTTRRPALDVLGPADARGVLLDATRSELTRDDVANIIGAAGLGLTEQTVVDDESVAKYGPRRYSRRDLLLQDEGACQAWADELVVWTREARPGAITRLVLWPIGAPQLWPLVCRLDPLLPLGLDLDGTTRPEYPIVAGYSHDVTARDWRVTLTLTPHPLDGIEGSPFTLDHPDRSRLDAGNVTT